MSALSQWLMYSAAWYILLLAIGLIFFPLTRVIFHKFYDYGYGFAKAFGIVCLSYTMYVLGTIKLVPFTQVSLLLILAGFGYLSYRVYKRNPLKKDSRLSLIVAQEVLFLLSFLLWAYVRSKEPSIRGLEKFMDYGFMNSILRGEYFPSQDMWLAGHSINYYYFGHITGAVLTKLNVVPSFIAYNLILAQIFALSIAGTFTLGFNIAYHAFKHNLRLSFITGALSAFIVNFAGNLHTIYAFTKGYPNDNPAPFWTLPAKYTLSDLSKPLEALDKLPQAYWYPNATRFIPLTIHEFPLYSYVVADLHGHVFDIPFVLITIGLLFSLFINSKGIGMKLKSLSSGHFMKAVKKDLSFKTGNLGYVLLISFFISIHLMTNAFDAPIYLALTGIMLFAMFGLSQELFLYGGVVAVGFYVFNIPFTSGFEPFATGVGFNCAPASLQTTMNSLLGPKLAEKFLFEGNCQSSPWWQILLLWGFFWFNFIFLVIHTIKSKLSLTRIESFMLILFAFSTLLIAAPEFVYAKDIYPSHFRANTMFKLGYQAFILYGLGSAFVFTLFKQRIKKSGLSVLYITLFIPLFGLIALYPTFAIESFYGSKEAFKLDGEAWIAQTAPEYYEIIQYLNKEVDGQPVILEAQGDSYTDFNLVSAYTGLPTVGGWFVHEWLWRGDSDAVGALSPDIQRIYESDDADETKRLLQQFNVEYVIVGSNERSKYEDLNVSKFEALGKAVFKSKVNSGAVYQIPIDTH